MPGSIKISAVAVFRRVILLITVGAMATVFAQQTLRFERIGREQGLYQRHITSIFQDREGFMWFGTTDGLCRYDGHTLRSYRFDPLDSTSISGNYVQQIFQDSRRGIWVVTSGGGINRLMPGTGTFRHFFNVPTDSFSLSNDDVSVFLEDSAGRIWIGTKGGGLNWYHPQEERFYHIRQNLGNPASLSNNFISSLCEDTLGNLWIGTNGGGLNRLNSADLPGLPDASLIAGLTFERFYARGSTYTAAVYDSLDMLVRSSRYISAIQRPEPAQEHLDFFQLTAPTAALIVSVGNSGPFDMSDYGWLEADDESVIWKMTYQQSCYLSGQTKSRIQAGVLNLPVGTYRLRYRSGTYGMTPETFEERRLWGVQLFLLDSDQEKFFRANLPKRNMTNGLPHNWVTTLTLDPQNQLLIGTADGLAVLPEVATTRPMFRRLTLPPSFASDETDAYISKISAGYFGSLPGVWAQTVEGMIMFRQSGRDTLLPVFPLSHHGQTEPQATTFWQENGGKIWIGTTDKGLFCLNLQTGNSRPTAPGEFPFQHFFPTANPVQSLSDVHITALYQDQADILWIGTAQGGLNKLNRTRQPFRHIQHIPDQPQSLSHPVVTAIWEDRDETLWVGTYGGGINRLTRNDRNVPAYQFAHFRSDRQTTGALQSDFITSLYQDQSGNMWAGTHGAGLAQIRQTDDGQMAFVHYRHDPLKSNSISNDYVNTIYEDQYGQLWIGTNSGLNQFDRLTRRFTRYRHDANNPHSLSDNEVWAIYEDASSQGRSLWIGTRSGGINKFDRQNNRFIRYNREFDNPNSLNNPAVLSIYEDSAGRLWFGTYSGGLNRFDHETQQFTFFTERDGLANNMIFGILEDSRGNLWLSTNKGISKFSPSANTFQNFEMADGLQADEFRAGAQFRNRRGEMYFGGINGITVFHPDSVRNNPHVPNIRFTSLTIMGENSDRLLNKAISGEHPISLSYLQDIVSFEFAALDFNNPAKNRFAYKLEGLHKDWIDNGNRNFVSFTNLPPGEYTLRVRGSNNDGLWNETGASIDLVINPPFWKTWWFVTMVVVLMGAVTLVAINWRIRQKINRLMEIEQVRQQENERVRTKAAHDFHDELGHKLTKISLFSEIVKRQMQSASPEVLDYLNRIGETAKGLSGGMRDFIWTLDPGKDTLYEVVVRLKDFGDELFDKTGVDFRVEGLSRKLESVHLSSDWRRHLTLIFKEAMNNALKHARCRKVILKIGVTEGQLLLALTDDGRGIPHLTGNGKQQNGSPDEADIFSSTGNGMKNMRLRAEKLNGTIHVQPNTPNGVCIQFAAKMP